MAVHYLYTMDPAPTNHEVVNAGGLRDDGAIIRKLAIPENTEEELRGSTYSQEDIDWLHNSERQNIVASLPPGASLLKVWTEKIAGFNDNGSYNYQAKGKLANNIPLQPAANN